MQIENCTNTPLASIIRTWGLFRHCDMSAIQNKIFSITTPLYYVNGLPHIGSAYTTMAADAIARFHRLRGEEVLLITGTDEHGQKIQRTAEQMNREPQAHCDEVAAGFKDLWNRLNIQYDRFSRTTSDRHTSIVKEFFQRVWDKGDIYLSQQQGWYCVDCEEFKEERDLLPSKICPIHVNRPVEWRDEQNYFFRLSRYQQALEAHYAAHPSFIQPDIRRNEVLSFVSSGLQDFSISRVNLDWGIPVPADPSHTLYVWFDALLGYVTALLEPDELPTLDNALKKWWPINLHLIGKDILRFHAVYWPAMLMSADLSLPGAVYGHGFLTKDGQKMGKTLGNTLDPFELVGQYGVDAVRYYFLKEIDFSRDGDFNETRFVNILNADLANDLGNLLNRTLKMAVKYCDGKVPLIDHAEICELPFVKVGQVAGVQAADAYNALSFNTACEIALNLGRAGNKFIDEQAPWSRYKEGDLDSVNQTLYAVLESVRLAAYLLAPVVPDLSTKVYQQLGYQVNFNDWNTILQEVPYATHSQWGTLPLGQVLGHPEPIFQKLEILAPDPV
jgi:methionyl-tRNA synthetase